MSEVGYSDGSSPYSGDGVDYGNFSDSPATGTSDNSGRGGGLPMGGMQPSHGSSAGQQPLMGPVTLPPPSSVPLKKTCEVCSREKIKCDGKLPTCSRCERLRKPCHYTINKSKQLKVHKIAMASMSAEAIAATYGIGAGQPNSPGTPGRAPGPGPAVSSGPGPAPSSASSAGPPTAAAQKRRQSVPQIKTEPGIATAAGVAAAKSPPPPAKLKRTSSQAQQFDDFDYYGQQQQSLPEQIAPPPQRAPKKVARDYSGGSGHLSQSSSTQPSYMPLQPAQQPPQQLQHLQQIPTSMSMLPSQQQQPTGMPPVNNQQRRRSVVAVGPGGEVYPPMPAALMDLNAPLEQLQQAAAAASQTQYFSDQRYVPSTTVPPNGYGSSSGPSGNLPFRQMPPLPQNMGGGGGGNGGMNMNNNDIINGPSGIWPSRGFNNNEGSNMMPGAVDMLFSAANVSGATGSSIGSMLPDVQMTSKLPNSSSGPVQQQQQQHQQMAAMVPAPAPGPAPIKRSRTSSMSGPATRIAYPSLDPASTSAAAASAANGVYRGMDQRAMANEDMIVNMISFDGFRDMGEFVEVIRMYFRSILPFVPVLHRMYYIDMLTDDPTWHYFVAQTELLPLSSEYSQQGADKQTVQAFHLHAKNVLYTVINSLGVPPSRLPVNALRDLLLLLMCIMPSLSMTLESPVTYSLFMLTLSMARSLGMNEEPESGWGLDSERGIECPWTKGERETSRRIWWSLYTLDKQIAAIWEHLPLIADAECRGRLPVGEGFLHDDQDPSPTSQKPHYIADAMANLDVKFQRTAPRSAWFSLIGLHGIIGSITVYRAECVASRTEPYIPNPVLEQLQKRLQTWYDGLDPSVRLMDKEGVILGPAAAAFDRTHTDGPRSVVLLLHTLLVFHAAGCLLHAPTGNIVSHGWERSPSFQLCMESAIRSGRVLKMMLIAGEESKLTTPFHVFAVHMTALMHVIWLLALKKRLSGSWKFHVVGNVVTVVADEDAAASASAGSGGVSSGVLTGGAGPRGAVAWSSGAGAGDPAVGEDVGQTLARQDVETDQVVGLDMNGVAVSAVPPHMKREDGPPQRISTPDLFVTTTEAEASANPLKGMDPAMDSTFLGADDDDDPSQILFGAHHSTSFGARNGDLLSLGGGNGHGLEGPMSPMFSPLGVAASNQRDLEDLLGVSPGDTGHQEGSVGIGGASDDGNGSIGGVKLGESALGNGSDHVTAPDPTASSTFHASANHSIESVTANSSSSTPPIPPTFLASTIQHHTSLRADPGKPLSVNEIQRMTWSDFFRIIKSLQFHMQTLSVLGTRARVRPLALRSKGVLIRLLEETDRPGPANHFSTVLLADCGLGNVGGM